MGAGEDEGNGLEEGAEAVGIAGLVGAGHDIGAVKGHQGRQGAVMLEEREEMDAGVAEVDVEEVRVPVLEDAEQGTVFAAVDEGGFAADVFEVEAAEEVAPGGGDHFDLGEGEFFSALALFAEDEGAVAFQSGDLAVDMQHFRFEESGAVAGDGGHGEKGRMAEAPGIGNVLHPGERWCISRATKKLRRTGAFL